jgi:hypothetical protein
MSRCSTLKVLLATILLEITMSCPTAHADSILLDDFMQSDGRSALGTTWQGFTDRVMGGRSDMEAGYVETEAGPALRMRGTVRLDNNGGFVQVRLPLARDRQTLDASAATAFVVEARGAPGPYYLHLRTTDTRRPWAYYRAPLDVAEEWRRLVVPLSAFEPVSTRTPLDRSRLLSLGLVAYGEPFEADLIVRRLELRVPADSADSGTGDDR